MFPIRPCFVWRSVWFLFFLDEEGDDDVEAEDMEDETSNDATATAVVDEEDSNEGSFYGTLFLKRGGLSFIFLKNTFIRLSWKVLNDLQNLYSHTERH